MLARRASGDHGAGLQPWGSTRILMALAGAALIVLVVVAGAGFAVYSMFTTEPPTVVTGDPGGGPGQPADLDPAGSTGDPQGDPTRARGDETRDRLAAAPMYPATPEDFRPQEPSTRPSPMIRIPPAEEVGPAGVPTGFPRTPEGAVGQLGAITATVLTGMDIRQANDIFQAWTQPGAGDGSDWALTTNVQAFIGDTKTKPVTTTVVVTPRAGLVKAVDGPGWVTACVLVQVRATITTEAEIAYGHCERMVWRERRWVIEAAPAAARAPSTWPGSEAALQAGWREWVHVAAGRGRS